MIKTSPKFYYCLIGLISFVYLLLLFNTPTDPSSPFKLSPSDIFLIRLTFVIPILFIWFAGTFAFVSLGRHIELIRGSKEEPAYTKMRLGIGVIFWSSVTASLINTSMLYLNNGVAAYPARPIVQIIMNYFNVFPILIGFSLLYFSARLFLKSIDAAAQTIKNSWKVIMGVIILIMAYICLELIFSNPSRTVPTVGSRGLATYYLEDSLIVLTIVFPLIVAWVIGLLGAKTLSIYAKLTNGKVYKAIFMNIVWGINSLVLLSIFLQTLSAIGGERFAALGLGEILFIIYVLIAIIGVAYIFLARGVRKLSQIEVA